MMPSAQDLIHRLEGQGVELKVEGEALHFRPKSAVSSDLLAQIKSMKTELIRIVHERNSHRHILVDEAMREFGPVKIVESIPERKYWRRFVKQRLLSIFHVDRARAEQLRDEWGDILHCIQAAGVDPTTAERAAAQWLAKQDGAQGRYTLFHKST